ncbi:MAG: flagellin [Bdellovibrionota bacterium]
MSLTIASNILSQKIQLDLEKTTNALAKTTAKLSSGRRIVDPSDDPAGFQVAGGLERDAKLATVAISSANDGLSLATITEDALDEISGLLTRMAELAEQSANGVVTQTQRSSISLEFLALGSEVDRIAKTTTFNNLNVLSNSSDVTLQIGFDSTTNSQLTIGAQLGTLESFSLAPGGSDTLSFSVIATTSAASEAAATTALAALSTAIDTVNSRRGSLGAIESRLSHAIENLQTKRLEYTTAEGRIRDVDAAEEIAG